jgi:hypothetical protein
MRRDQSFLDRVIGQVFTTKNAAGDPPHPGYVLRHARMDRAFSCGEHAKHLRAFMTSRQAVA